MRPDRFGQSRNKDFTESAGRDRGHPFTASDLATPAITLFATLQAFGTPTDIAGWPGATLGDFNRWRTHNPWRFYRTARLLESYAFTISGRTLDVSRDATFRFKDLLVARALVPGDYSYIEQTLNTWRHNIHPTLITDWLSNNTGAGYPYTVSETTMLANPEFSFYGPPALITLSERVDLGSLIRLLVKELEKLSNFDPIGSQNISHQLTTAPNIETPNPFPPQAGSDFVVTEIGPSGANLSGAASLQLGTLSNAVPFWPFPTADASHPEYAAKFSLPVRTVVVSVTKSLLPLKFSPAQIKRWQIRRKGYRYGGPFPGFVEDSCGLASAAEVVAPPPPDALGLPDILDEQYSEIYEINGFPTFHVEVRHFPGSQAAPVDGLIPTCAPLYQ